LTGVQEQPDLAVLFYCVAAVQTQTVEVVV
jgi:hypothetical protein